MENNSMDGSLASFGFQSSGDSRVANRGVKTVKTLVVNCAGGENFETLYDIAGNFMFFDFDDCAATFGIPVSNSLAAYVMQFSVMGEDGEPTDPLPFSQGTKFHGEFKGVSFKFGNLGMTSFRVIYGYDFDFDTPIKQIGVTRAQNSGLTVQISGTVSAAVTSFQSTVALAAGGVENIVLNTTNVSGIFVQHAVIGGLSAAASSHTLVAKSGAAAPVGSYDGAVLIHSIDSPAWGANSPVHMNYPKTVQGGRRLDRYSVGLQTTGLISLDYKANMPV